MERAKTIGGDILQIEMPKYIGELVDLQMTFMAGKISTSEFEGRIDHLRAKRDTMIQFHLLYLCDSLDLKGLKEQVLAEFKENGRLKDSIAHRYLVKTGFLGTVGFKQLEQESVNF